MKTLDWLFVLVYLAVLVVISVQSLRRVNSPDDFAVAGRRVVTPILFATMAASMLGGGAAVGTGGQVFTNGYVYLFAAFAFPLQTFLVGYFVAPRMTRYATAQTVGDVMEHHYGRASRLLTGILSIGLCAGVLGGQVLALGVVFNTIMGVSTEVGILIGMSIVLLYSAAGGMWAVVQTDVLQFVILGIFIPVTLFLGLTEVGGAAQLAESVPAGHFSLTGDWTLALFAGTFLAVLLGETLTPPYAQRAFSTRVPASARRAFMAAGIFGFGFFFVTATVGLIALVLFPDIGPDQALPTLVSNMLPAGVKGLVLAALAAVIMSSSDSFLNSTAVVFVRDIYQPFINPNIAQSRVLMLQRLVTVVVGVAAVVFALTAETIIDLLLDIYSLWAPTVIIPLILAVVWGFRAKAAALTAIIGGAAATVLWTWGLDEPFGLTGLVVGVGVNIVAFFVVYAAVDRRRRTPDVVKEGGTVQ